VLAGIAMRRMLLLMAVVAVAGLVLLILLHLRDAGKGVLEPTGITQDIRIIRIVETLAADADISELNALLEIGFAFPEHIRAIESGVRAEHGRWCPFARSPDAAELGHRRGTTTGGRFRRGEGDGTHV
jgi:hypothetical protein